MKSLWPARASAAEDVYQDAFRAITEPNPGLFPTFPALEFDTYITMPTSYSVTGSPVDIDPATLGLLLLGGLALLKRRR